MSDLTALTLNYEYNVTTETNIPYQLLPTPFQVKHQHLDFALTSFYFEQPCCNILGIDNYLLTKLRDTHHASHRPNECICLWILHDFLNLFLKSLFESQIVNLLITISEIKYEDIIRSNINKFTILLYNCGM